MPAEERGEPFEQHRSTKGRGETHAELSLRGREPGSDEERSVEEEDGAISEQLRQEGDGLTGAGTKASGTLPGSVAGTTGTGGPSGGTQSPGSRGSDRPGISPHEMSERRERASEP